jgi:hypothetical protein
MNECPPIFEYSWSYSWMVFIVRGFAMLDQVGVGGGEEDFHRSPVCLSAVFDPINRDNLRFVVNVVKNAICANAQRKTRVAFEFL